MNKQRLQRLQSAGWKVGNAEDFLGLTPAEATLVEIKVTLAASVRAHRLSEKLTQADLAGRLKSSQSRVAKIEAADRSVTVDLLLKSLLALGVTQSGVAKILSRAA